MKKTIEIVPYNPNWPYIYTKETMVPFDTLSDNLLDLRHFGSTFAPSLSAKPKIDIIAVVHNYLLARIS